MFVNRELVAVAYKGILEQGREELKDLRETLNHFNFGSICTDFDYYLTLEDSCNSLEGLLTALDCAVSEGDLDSCSELGEALCTLVDAIYDAYEVMARKIENLDSRTELNLDYMAITAPFCESDKEESMFNFRQVMEVANNPEFTCYVSWIQDNIRQFLGFKTKHDAMMYIMGQSNLGLNNLFLRHEAR